MTTAPTTRQPVPPTGLYDPIFGLQEKVASLLTPIFRSEATDDLFAYQVACRSLQAYEPETRADFVNAGRVLAFSLAAIALLAEAADPAMPRKDKIRTLTHANALNRSADQAERSMMDRRRHQTAYPPAPAPQPPTPDPGETQIQTQIAEAVATCNAAQNVQNPQAAAQNNTPSQPPQPARPEIKLEPPPVKLSAIPYGGPNRMNMPPNQPGQQVSPGTV